MYDGWSTTLLVTTIVTLIFSFLFFALRMYVKLGIQKLFTWDDYLIIGATISMIFSCTFVSLGAIYGGLGQHSVNISTVVQGIGQKWLFFHSIANSACLFFVRIAIAMLELRLGGGKFYSYPLYISMVCNLAYTIYMEYLLLGRCTPISKTWNIMEPGHCVAQTGVVPSAEAFTAVDVTFDWFYALLPVPLIWGLQMNVRTKTSVIAVLGIGILASIAPLVRIPIIKPMFASQDISFYFGPFTMLAIFQSGFAIMAACASTFRPLFKWLNERSTAYRYGSSGNSYAKRASRPRPGFNSFGEKRSSYLSRTNQKRYSEIELGLRPDGQTHTRASPTVDDPRGSDDFIIQPETSYWSGNGISKTVNVSVERYDISSSPSMTGGPNYPAHAL